MYSRTTKNRYAFVSARSAEGNNIRRLCYIELFLDVDIPLHGSDVRIQTQLALVQYYREHAPSMFPWHQRYVDCGLRAYSEDVEARRFIPVTDLAASTIVCRADTHNEDNCLFSLSCDTDGPEPEYWLRSTDDNTLRRVWEEEGHLQEDVRLERAVDGVAEGDNV